MTDRKKLKEAYKNMVPPKGIFALKNNINGRILLGSSLNLKGIEFRIRTMLNMNLHMNSELQNDWNEFGEKAFMYEIIETLDVNEDINYNYEDDLQILEMLWLEKFQPLAEKCYNKNDKIRVV